MDRISEPILRIHVINSQLDVCAQVKSGMIFCTIEHIPLKSCLISLGGIIVHMSIDQSSQPKRRGLPSLYSKASLIVAVKYNPHLLSRRDKNSLRKFESLRKAPRITLFTIFESRSLTPRHCIQK